MDASVLVFEPAVSRVSPPRVSRRGLDALAGKVIGFIDNAKPNFNYFVEDVAALLVSRYGVAAVVTRCKGGSLPVPESMLKELTEQCDAVIAGSGD